MSNNNIWNKKRYLVKKRHPWHMVLPSVWPFLTSMAVTNFLVFFICYLHDMPIFYSLFKVSLTFLFLILSFIFFLVILSCWFYDIIVEGTFFGHHTFAVERGLRLGMVLFIVSEVMFFFSFFWAFFHCSLNPSIHIGSIWPPKGIITFDPWGIPFLNTIILLGSGATLTFAHHSFFIRNRIFITVGTSATVFLGCVFTCIQIFEYWSAPFRICDGIYASCFFLLTGFHGFHVLIGTIFLIVTLIRHLEYHFSATYHFGFEAAAWYWHFVDVVWIFLYLSLYCWGA